MENKPKQTAVDYLFIRLEALRGLFLFEEIDYKTYVDEKKDAFEKAKEMENQQDKFTNAPIHDKKAIIEMMNELHPKEMIEVVEFIKSKIETYGKQ